MRKLVFDYYATNVTRSGATIFTRSITDYKPGAQACFSIPCNLRPEFSRLRRSQEKDGVVVASLDGLDGITDSVKPIEAGNHHSVKRMSRIGGVRAAV